MHPYLIIAGLSIALALAAFGVYAMSRQIFYFFLSIVYFLKEWIGRYEYGKHHHWFNPKDTNQSKKR